MFGIFGIGLGLILAAMGGAAATHVAENGLSVEVPPIVSSK